MTPTLWVTATSLLQRISVGLYIIYHWEQLQMRLVFTEERELKRVLQSLSLGQHKLLIKEPPSGSISTGDTFKYNVGFTAPSVRLKVNMVQQEQTTEESKATETKVLVDRQHQVFPFPFSINYVPKIDLCVSPDTAWSGDCTHYEGQEEVDSYRAYEWIIQTSQVSTGGIYTAS